ncbi:MAG: hypothetical protein WDZ70_01260 [Candidatus Paceibacterota bacterium]
MKDIIQTFLEVLGQVLLFGLLAILLIAAIKADHSELIDYLGVVIWPAIVLIALLFFRKVFTFLFFSMENFNFFGAKGRLRNVEEVIREKARELHEEEKRGQEILEEQNQLKEKVAQLEGQQITREQWEEITDELLKKYQNLSRDYFEIIKETHEFEKQIEALLNQIAMLQAHLVKKD